MSITACPAPTRIGGERHDKETLRRWFERLGRVQPNLHLKVNNIWVKGWPWHTTVFVQWDGTATLLNGDASYFNRGLHVITLRWGRIYALDVFEDSQEAARGLAAQAAAIWFCPSAWFHSYRIAAAWAASPRAASCRIFKHIDRIYSAPPQGDHLETTDEVQSVAVEQRCGAVPLHKHGSVLPRPALYPDVVKPAIKGYSAGRGRGAQTSGAGFFCSWRSPPSELAQGKR